MFPAEECQVAKAFRTVGGCLCIFHGMLTPARLFSNVCLTHLLKLLGAEKTIIALVLPSQHRAAFTRRLQVLNREMRKSVDFH